MQPSEHGSLKEQLQDLELLGIVWTENTMYDEFLITITVQNGWYVLSIVAIEGTKRTTFQQLPAEIDSFAALSEASV